MPLAARLSALEAGDLVRLESSTPELAYTFRHVLVRDAVYATLTRTERARLHQAVGEVLERLHPDQAQTLPLAPQLGAHFAEAGDQARALKYLTLAGDQAARQYANREAAQYYDRALAIGRRQPSAPLSHLYLARGRALELSGDYASALAGYAEMETQARQRGDEALELEALVAQARLHNLFTVVSDPAQGQSVLERALELARRRGAGEAEVHLHLYRMRRFVLLGDSAQIIRYGEQAIAGARALGSAQLLAEGLIELARFGHLDSGQLLLGRQRLDEARALLRGLDDPPRQVECLIGLAQSMLASGEFQPLLELLAEMKQVSDRIGYGWGLAQYHVFRGNIHLDQGRLGEAIRHLEESIRAGRQFSVALVQLVTCAYLSRAWAGVGETAAALAAVRAIHDSLAESAPSLLRWPLAAEGSLLLAEGRVAEAAQVIARARQMGAPRDMFAYRLMLHTEAELGLAQGSLEQVTRVTGPVIAAMRPQGARLVLCEALAYHGRALAGAAEVEQARPALREARALVQEMGLAPILWRVLAAQAELETKQGDLAAANSLRDQAREVIMKLAEQTGAPARRAGFLARREVQAVLRPAG